VDEITSKKDTTIQGIWRFVQLYWLRSATGFLLGAILGLGAGTIKHFADRGLKIGLKFVHSYLWNVTILLRHRKGTLLVIVAVAAIKLFGTLSHRDFHISSLECLSDFAEIEKRLLRTCFK
jgi:hypothetical protein